MAGTWLQTSDKVSPRNPFKQDTALLDYDYDSDADWEEELEGAFAFTLQRLTLGLMAFSLGESLDQSEGEEEDIDESDEEDDGFMVPDGYEAKIEYHIQSTSSLKLHLIGTSQRARALIRMKRSMRSLL